MNIIDDDYVKTCFVKSEADEYLFYSKLQLPFCFHMENKD